MQGDRKEYKGQRVMIKKLAKAERVLGKGATSQEVQEKARQLALDALKSLGEIVNSEEASDNTKVSASALIFERAYGKAAQTNINANVNANAPREIDAAELDKRIRETLERVEVITNRTREKIISEERPPDIRKFN